MSAQSNCHRHSHHHHHHPPLAPPPPPPHHVNPTPSADLLSCNYYRSSTRIPVEHQDEDDEDEGAAAAVAVEDDDGDGDEECVEDNDQEAMIRTAQQKQQAELNCESRHGSISRIIMVRDGDGDWLDLRLGSFTMDHRPQESELMHKRSTDGAASEASNKFIDSACQDDQVATNSMPDYDENGWDCRHVDGMLTLQLLPRTDSETDFSSNNNKKQPWKLTDNYKANPCLTDDLLHHHPLLPDMTYQNNSSTSSSTAIPRAPSLHCSRINGSFPTHITPDRSSQQFAAIHPSSHSIYQSSSTPLLQSVIRSKNDPTKDQLPYKPGLRVKPKVSGFWFTLQPDDPYHPVEEDTPRPYLRIKDGEMPIHAVKKYLATKLGLSSESQVELRCRGRCLPENASLKSVRDEIWLPPDSNIKKTLSFNTRNPNFRSSGNPGPNPNPNPDNFQLVKECVPILSYHISRS